MATQKIETALIADDAVTSAKLDTNIDIAGTLDVTGATTLDSTLSVSGNITGTLATAAQPNITSVGTLTGLTTTGDINFGDNDKATFNSNLNIFSSGTSSYIEEVGTGDLYLKASNLYITDRENYQFMSLIDNGTGGTISLMHNGATKLATTSTGIDVTGTATMDGLTVNSSEVLFDNTGGDFTLKLNTNAVSDKNEIIMGDSGTPLAKFGVGGTANDIITGSDGQDFNIGTAGGGRAINFSTDNFASVEMKLDGGNLLVGKTTTAFGTAGVRAIFNGQLQATADGNEPLGLNRLSSDGSLIDFYKDTLPVGSIGTLSGLLGIGNGDAGLLMAGSVDAVAPYNASTNATRDAAIDLGTATNRFKDLYLSGGAYLGGTGSANKLDDYEEGTWTAYQNSGLTAAMGSATQHYTKIGRQVILRFDITNNSGSSADRIYGTPFSNNGHGTMFVGYSNIANDNKVGGYTDSGSIRLTLLGQTGSWSIPNNYRIIGTAWYITD